MLSRLPDLVDYPGIRHGFTSRMGGVCQGPWGPMTLAARSGLADGELRENWRRAVVELGEGTADELALMHQVHGATVVEAKRGAGPLAVVAEADGMWTAEVGVILAVRTADCVPILILSPRGVAVAHAGWRGVAGRVVQATVRALCAGTGCGPETLVAAVGPHISGQAYEVGGEVVAGLMDAGLERETFLHAHPGHRAHVDLGRAVDAQLKSVGVTQVSHARLCTFQNRAFHSYRRDGAASGRNAGMVVRCGG